jgi:hypothetical protein
MTCDHCYNHTEILNKWDGKNICDACLRVECKAMVKAAMVDHLSMMHGDATTDAQMTDGIRCILSRLRAPSRTDVDRLMDAARRDVAANERRRKAAK